MKFRYLTAATVLLSFLLVCPRSIAVDTKGFIKSDAQILKSMKGVSVGVSDISVEAKKEGLSTLHIQTNVELRLRQAGIKVFEMTERKDIINRSHLSVNITCVKQGEEPVYAFSVNVELGDTVTLHRDPQVVVFYATTWKREEVGIVGSIKLVDSIRNIVDHITDAFLNDYLKANPKK